jgi:hypothetical protein
VIRAAFFGEVSLETRSHDLLNGSLKGFTKGTNVETKLIDPASGDTNSGLEHKSQDLVVCGEPTTDALLRGERH